MYGKKKNKKGKSKKQQSAIAIAKKKIEREKMVDKMKHARMLDRAKIRKLKNRGVTNA